MFKQLLALKISAVVLYLSAMVYNVSFVLTTICSQPAGALQITGAVALGSTGATVSVGASIVLIMMGGAVDSTSDVTMMGGNDVAHFPELPARTIA